MRFAALLVLASLLACGLLASAPVGGGALAAGSDAAGASQASGCAARLPPSPLSSRPGATVALVPPGATSLLLCSYHGLNPSAQANTLERSRTVTGASVLARLAREFNALPKTPPGIFCPMDDGSATLAIFIYADAPPDPVSVGMTGCQIVTNGHVSRTAALAPGPALLRELTALLG